MKLCECGCNQEVRNEKFRFLRGHNNRGQIFSLEARRNISLGHLGKPSGMLGKHWSEEKKEKLRKPRSEEFKQKVRIGCIGKNKGKQSWCKGLTSETDERVSIRAASISGHVTSEETRRKIGEANRLARQDPTKYRNTGQIKGYFFSAKNNDNIPYRSSYELEYLKQLESDPLVVTYEYESLRIEYQFNGVSRTTIPDFLVHYTDGHTELVEVKANWCLNDESIRCKLEAVKRYASKSNLLFLLVTETCLSSLTSEATVEATRIARNSISGGANEPIQTG